MHAFTTHRCRLSCRVTPNVCADNSKTLGFATPKFIYRFSDTSKRSDYQEKPGLVADAELGARTNTQVDEQKRGLSVG